MHIKHFHCTGMSVRDDFWTLNATLYKRYHAGQFQSLFEVLGPLAEETDFDPTYRQLYTKLQRLATPAPAEVERFAGVTRFLLRELNAWKNEISAHQRKHEELQRVAGRLQVSWTERLSELVSDLHQDVASLVEVEELDFQHEVTTDDWRHMYHCYCCCWFHCCCLHC